MFLLITMVNIIVGIKQIMISERLIDKEVGCISISIPLKIAMKMTAKVISIGTLFRIHLGMLIHFSKSFCDLPPISFTSFLKTS